MSIALFDNATLTAVQRLLGIAPARSNDSIDGDIVAFENLIQGILFFNKWVVLDDYKQQYTEQRKQIFDFVDFINPNNFNLDEVEQKARELNQDVQPTIRGGEFVDKDFKKLFNQLQTHIICTWDISSSIYYLNLKMLGEEGTGDFKKFSKIAASIFNELDSNHETKSQPNNNFKLYDSKGNEIGDEYKIKGARWSNNGKTGGLSSGLSTFLSALSWISYETIYYTLAANYFKADSLIYPLRQTFQLNFLESVNTYDHNLTSGIVGSLNKSFKEEIELIVNQTNQIALDISLPIFSAWVIEKVGSIDNVIEYALELREKDEFTEVRNQLGEIRNLFEENPTEASNKISKIKIKALKAIKLIRKRYGLPNDLGLDATGFVQVYNSSRAIHQMPKIPALKSKIKLPTWLEELRHRKGFSAIYKNIGKEIENVWKLGKYKELLSKKYRISDKRSYNPKTEDPKYRNYHSRWKSPM